MIKKWIVLILLLIVLLAACTETENNMEEADEPVFPVEVAQASLGILHTDVTLPATIVPRQQQPVLTMLTGEISELHVQNGDEVAQGDILARLDATDMELNIQQAQAGLDAANASLASARAMRDAGISQAQLQLEQARQAYTMIQEAAAQTELSSDDEDLLENVPEELTDFLRGILSTTNTVDSGDIEQARMAVRTAEIGLEQAQDSSSVDAAQASVEQAQITLQMAEQQQDQVFIYAPIDGQIVGVDSVVGQMVSPQAPLMQIVQLDPPIVQANVNETQLSLVQVDQQVDVHVTAFNDTFAANVSYISPVPAEQSLSYALQMEFQEDTDIPQMRAGLTAQVNVAVSDNEEYVLLPIEAVRHEGDAYYVYITTDGRHAFQRMITIHSETSQWIAVEEGLEEGEYVIVRGHHALHDGAFITTQNEDNEDMDWESTPPTDDTSNDDPLENQEEPEGEEESEHNEDVQDAADGKPADQHTTLANGGMLHAAH